MRSARVPARRRGEKPGAGEEPPAATTVPTRERQNPLANPTTKSIPMLLRKLVLLLPLTFLAPGALDAQTLSAPAPGSAAATPHGTLGGGFDLPSPLRRGTMVGVIRDDQGRPIMKLVASVDRDRLRPTTGTLKGHVELLNGPRAGKKFAFVGQWHVDSKGDGSFRGNVLGRKRPGEKRPVLLKTRGGFHDDRLFGGPGTFKGRWHAA